MLEANAKAAAGRTDPLTVDDAARPRFQQALATALDDLLDTRATARRVSRAAGEALHLGFVALFDARTSSMLSWWPDDIARREHGGECEVVKKLDGITASLPFLPVPERCGHVPVEIGTLGAVPLVDGQGEVIGALVVGANDRPWFDDTFRVELRWYALQIGKALSVALTCERLAASATRDDLTGLLRRDDFYQRFTQEIARAKRTETRLALLRWDFVSFAEFNGRHGRRVGDRALRAFADAIRADLRTYDVAGRIDGDDMAALLFVGKHQEAHIAAARIQKRAAITRVGNVFIPFPARGYALYPDDGDDVTVLDKVSLVRLGNHRDARLSFIRKDESMSIVAPSLPSSAAAAD
jgi:diguanylate cyclase (GGDEF)-like protein